MPVPEWEHFDAAKHKGLKRGQLHQVQLWLPSPLLGGSEAVVVDAPNALQGLWRAEDGDPNVVLEVELSQIVEAEEMIGMGVGQDASIHAPDFVGEALRAEVRACVY